VLPLDRRLRPCRGNARDRRAGAPSRCDPTRRASAIVASDRARLLRVEVPGSISAVESLERCLLGSLRARRVKPSSSASGSTVSAGFAMRSSMASAGRSTSATTCAAAPLLGGARPGAAARARRCLFSRASRIRASTRSGVSASIARSRRRHVAFEGGNPSPSPLLRDVAASPSKRCSSMRAVKGG
jgi:hypothetical protein